MNQEPQAQNLIFFSCFTTGLHKSLQGLNSPLDNSAAEIWLLKTWPEMDILRFVFAEN